MLIFVCVSDIANSDARNPHKNGHFYSETFKKLFFKDAAFFAHFSYAQKCSFLCGFRASRKATPEIHTKMNTFSKKDENDAARKKLNFLGKKCSFFVDFGHRLSKYPESAQK